MAAADESPRAADEATAPESWPLLQAPVRPARKPSNVWSVTVRSGSSVSHREIISACRELAQHRRRVEDAREVRDQARAQRRWWA
jgi:hypothetical protein